MILTSPPFTVTRIVLAVPRCIVFIATVVHRSLKQLADPKCDEKRRNNARLRLVFVCYGCLYYLFMEVFFTPFSMMHSDLFSAARSRAQTFASTDLNSSAMSMLRAREVVDGLQTPSNERKSVGNGVPSSPDSPSADAVSPAESEPSADNFGENTSDGMEDDEEDPEDYYQELDDKGVDGNILNGYSGRLMSPDEVHTIFK